MNKNELVKILTESGIEDVEAKAEVELILESVLNKTREELLFIDDFEDERVLEIVNKRAKTKEPVQYLLGFSYFMKNKFKVTKETLIPRDDTELLVRKTMDIIERNKKTKILDIGTGSGIIACSIGFYSKSDVEILGIDVSLGALQIAIDNMQKLNLTRRVMFRKSDLFSNIYKDEKFDIIVSNPPYIPKKDFEKIQEEVKFEPSIALYTEDEDGLYFYKKIIKQAKNHLVEGGYLLFEMMKGQAQDIKELLQNEGYSEIETFKDIQNIERVIVSRKIMIH